jgi:hypothetical protein
VISRAAEPFAWALFIVGTWLFTITVGLWVGAKGQAITLLFFRDQDAPVLLFCCLALFVMYRWRNGLLRGTIARPPTYYVAFLIIFPLLASAAGTFILFGEYALSRDELLANFDADFLRTGSLVAQVPLEWRPFANAMMPLYMHSVPGHAVWLSGYLPGNAAIRAAMDVLVGKSLTNPFLAAIAVTVLFGVARRLWPLTPGRWLIPPLLLATSPQLLTMAMTPYAMTPHLAFNLLWLWCFLRNDRRGDISSLVAGFVATGLHQLIYHPIFVTPFIAELLLARRWRRAGYFILGYALIGIFWSSYWQLAVPAMSESGLHRAVAEGVPHLAEQARGLLALWNFSSPLFMVYNLLRLAAWQHLLLLPLVLLSWPAIRRAEGIARPLAAGIVMMLAVLILLLPWQAHGWGYRYLHGFLGSFCLLATYGWAEIRNPLQQRQRNVALGLATGLGLLVIWPFQLLTAYRFVEPYREAQSHISQSGADIVLVDATGMLAAQDLVRNQPDASNTPKVMDIAQLSEAKLRYLCGRYKVAVFDRRQGAQARIPWDDTGDLSGERSVLKRIGCADQEQAPLRG